LLTGHHSTRCVLLPWLLRERGLTEGHCRRLLDEALRAHSVLLLLLLLE